MNIFEKNPRPTFNKKMIDELAIIVAENIHEVIRNNRHDEILKDTKKILSNAHDYDGFQLAKEFESEGYHVDSMLVEALDMTWSEKDDILNRYIKDWVKFYKIEPPLNIGDIITFRYGHKKCDGEITSFNKEMAYYLVCIESEGMSKEGSTRAVIKYEDAELVKKLENA